MCICTFSNLPLRFSTAYYTFHLFLCQYVLQNTVIPSLKTFKQSVFMTFFPQQHMKKKLNLRSSKVSCQVLLNKVNAMRMKSYVWDLKVQCRGIPIGLLEYISVVVQWLQLNKDYFQKWIKSRTENKCHLAQFKILPLNDAKNSIYIPSGVDVPKTQHTTNDKKNSETNIDY